LLQHLAQQKPCNALRFDRVADAQDERSSNRFQENAMPRGDKSGNPKVKPHRARKIAESLRRSGATRAAANTIATAAMDREYSKKKTGNPLKAKQSYDEEAHDSRSGQKKTNLTTKRGAAVSGASKPSTARKPALAKRAGIGSGAAAPARRPRASADPGTLAAGAKQSTTGRRPPRPVGAAGASAAKKK
jgi:hypothetical protein